MVLSTLQPDPHRPAPESVPGKVFPPNLAKTIIKLLDPPNIEQNDWHKLAADILHMQWQDIRYYEAQLGYERGPTFLLLLEWEARSLTLDQFKEAMEEIGRFDVAAEVQEFLENNKVGEIGLLSIYSGSRLFVNCLAQ